MTNDPVQMPHRKSRGRRLVATRCIASLTLGAWLVGAVPGGNPLPMPLLPRSMQPMPLRRSGFADIIERVKPAVVGVRVKVEEGVSSDDTPQQPPFPPGSPLDRFFRQFGSHPVPKSETTVASGFFVSGDGYIVTNNHVIANGKSFEVTTDDGKTYQAKVIGTDPQTDVALIKVSAPRRLLHTSSSRRMNLGSEIGFLLSVTRLDSAAPSQPASFRRADGISERGPTTISFRSTRQ